MSKILKAKKTFEEAGFTFEDIRRMSKCSIKQIYHALRGSFNKVSWKRLVCRNAGCPRWTFTLTIAAHGKLYTKDRLSKWGVKVDQMCVLCTKENETVQHLFFECSFAAKLWGNLLQWQGINRIVYGWNEELAWAEDWVKRQNANTELYKMTLAACVYHVWQERNARIFEEKERKWEMLGKRIIQEIHCRSNKRVEKALGRLDW
ncbi:PREDICTED: uncharacterized protein LOC109212485 [Nicotiana attenuata]|uniref:uncharacterized protein LOC109212485 n=1 Tax=Nicotiana attenuata TaxID=49451 RepID=UPI00090559F4|nr:PREDICTED: uncharacterized protein LOC109212485 [Nicotiana attenuata]